MLGRWRDVFGSDQHTTVLASVIHLLTVSTSVHHQGVYWLYRVATERRFVMATEESDYRLHGVRIVHDNELDPNTPQTPGMSRAAAINAARAGAEKLWAGTVVIHPDAKTGPHHHGHLESVIYVVAGRARMRWGDHLEYTAEAGPGDFIYVPPYVPHQEINASPDAPLSCVVIRSDQEPVVINLDLPDVEPDPEHVQWVDDIHPPH
jgi:uncharacterized RmlC-like cupin family protein